MNVVQKAAATLQPEKYAKKAWIVLDRDAHPRKACIAVVEWPWFDRIVMVLIVLNCATMALFTDPILTAKMHQATRRSASPSLATFLPLPSITTSLPHPLPTAPTLPIAQRAPPPCTPFRGRTSCRSRRALPPTLLPPRRSAPATPARPSAPSSHPITPARPPKHRALAHLPFLRAAALCNPLPPSPPSMELLLCPHAPRAHATPPSRRRLRRNAHHALPTTPLLHSSRHLSGGRVRMRRIPCSGNTPTRRRSRTLRITTRFITGARRSCDR